MKLWLLRPIDGLKIDDNPWEPWYDKAFGFVVRAATEEEARALAHAEAEKAELVRKCAEICDKASRSLGIDLQFDKGYQYACKKIKAEILSLLPNDQRSE